jgi:hypothetical protein
MAGRASSPGERETDVNRKSVVSKKASDLARIDRMKDRDIDYSDIPQLDKTFFKKADDGLAAGEKAIDHSSG